MNATRGQVAPKTARRRLTSLRSYGRWAGQADFLSKYKPPTAAPPQPHPLPGGIKDVETMIQCIDTNRLDRPQQQVLIGLCGLCGARVGEACATRFSWINNHERIITIRGKGDKSRHVPISDRAWKYIEPVFIAARNSVMEDDPRLAPFPDRTARAMITRAGMIAGIARPVASHDLRATFATAAYEATHDMRAVQELLGHASIETTQGYVAAGMQAMRKAVNF